MSTSMLVGVGMSRGLEEFEFPLIVEVEEPPPFSFSSSDSLCACIVLPEEAEIEVSSRKVDRVGEAVLVVLATADDGAEFVATEGGPEANT